MNFTIEQIKLREDEFKKYLVQPRSMNDDEWDESIHYFAKNERYKLSPSKKMQKQCEYCNEFICLKYFIMNEPKHLNSAKCQRLTQQRINRGDDVPVRDIPFRIFL